MSIMSIANNQFANFRFRTFPMVGALLITSLALNALSNLPLAQAQSSTEDEDPCADTKGGWKVACKLAFSSVKKARKECVEICDTGGVLDVVDIFSPISTRKICIWTCMAGKGFKFW